jgi:hypothetical protein
MKMMLIFVLVMLLTLMAMMIALLRMVTTPTMSILAAKLPATSPRIDTDRKDGCTVDDDCVVDDITNPDSKDTNDTITCDGPSALPSSAAIKPPS